MSYARPDILASVQRDGLARVEFYWVGEPGERGAKVVKTDEHGMRWTLDVDSTHWVTQRVAAGLLNVSIMAVNRWEREGRFGKRLKRNGVSVISMKAVERLAEARGTLPR